MSDENKAVVDRITEVFNGGDIEVLDELLAEGFVEHNPLPGADADRDGFKRTVRELREAFPDLETEVDLKVADGDLVANHWTSSGTHEGEFMGAPATGNTVSVEGIDISRVADGRVVEHWGQMDSLALLQQLGAIEAEAEEPQEESAEETAEQEAVSREEAPA